MLWANHAVGATHGRDFVQECPRAIRFSILFGRQHGGFLLIGF